MRRDPAGDMKVDENKTLQGSCFEHAGTFPISAANNVRKNSSATHSGTSAHQRPAQSLSAGRAEDLKMDPLEPRRFGHGPR